jgi:protein involved in polysaccharide export with SLBB domain
LDRIDIIEDSISLPRYSKVTHADLMPSDLTYKVHPGDTVDLKIYGLYATNQQYPVVRRVDEGGYLRIPEVGDVLIAGLTAQAAQDLISSELGKKVMTHPSVQLEVLDHTGFTYTVYGDLARWGKFTLRNPDLRLIDVLALAGGVPQSTRFIYVIRGLPLSDSVLPSWDRKKTGDDDNAELLKQFPTNTEEPAPAINIEDLINQLDVGTTNTVSPEPNPIPTPEPQDESTPNIESLLQNLDIGDNDDTGEHSISPGIIQTGKHELIDIDDVVPVRKTASNQKRVPVDIDALLSQVPAKTKDSAFVYIPESDTWLEVHAESPRKVGSDKEQLSSKKNNSKMLERIIEVEWLPLKQGDSSYNIVIRPEDRIYVKGAPLGHLYIRGEIGRPGVFDYPRTGEKITLTEFITSAGDLGPIAVAEKVSLTRRLSDNTQATITLNYAAIIQRTEPDIFLKPNDLISIGTSWGATPMAIIRNGFRATYGFGFLLDRNFGNDVFGRPP